MSTIEIIENTIMIALPILGMIPYLLFEYTSYYTGNMDEDNKNITE